MQVPIAGGYGIFPPVVHLRGGRSCGHRQELMPPVDCWQSVYAVYDDGPTQRSKVQGRVS